MVTDEMPGNPVMSAGTQRNNVALGYGNSSSSAKCSHFFSLRAVPAMGLLRNPAGLLRCSVGTWLGLLSIPPPPGPAVLRAAGGSISWTCPFQ